MDSEGWPDGLETLADGAVFEALKQSGAKVTGVAELSIVLIDDAELARRREELQKAGGYHYPAHQTPWQEIQRGMVDELAAGMILKPAAKYRHIAQEKGIPRNNH